MSFGVGMANHAEGSIRRATQAFHTRHSPNA
jgi:hypothetical protein